MPPTMMVTVGAFAFAVPAAAAPALDEPEALLAQAAMVVAARKAAPAAPMRLVFISSPLSLCWMVRWVLGRAAWVRGRAGGWSRWSGYSTAAPPWVCGGRQRSRR